MNKTLYIFDIDGTLADCSRRYKKAGKEPSRKHKPTYDSWVARVQNARTLMSDKPVPGMIDFVKSVTFRRYVTGREQKWSTYTHNWLYKNNFPLGPVNHRSNGDYRSNAQYKEEVIQRLVRLHRYTSVVVVDDDPKGDIEKMCKKNGYTFLKAKSGS
jgi:phosphoglycolate phosphatase-like HAD superfamily hydrolase